MIQLPAGEGALVVRTDFGHQQAWDDLRELIRSWAPEGLLTNVRLVDDPGCQGITTEQLLALVPDDREYSYLGVADADTLGSPQRPRDRTLLIIDLDGEDPKGAFRAVASELASIDANLSAANLDFGDYADAVDGNGVFRGFDSPV